MSLSAREQHALDSIETALTGSDPDLAVLLATFGRLTSGEEMPGREKILGTRWWYRPRGRRWSRAWSLVRRVWRRLGWPRTGLLLGIVVSVGLVALAPVINRGSQRTCPAAWAAACARLVPAHAARTAQAPRTAQVPRTAPPSRTAQPGRVAPPAGEARR
jgi:hypothetical protein